MKKFEKNINEEDFNSVINYASSYLFNDSKEESYIEKSCVTMLKGVKLNEKYLNRDVFDKVVNDEEKEIKKTLLDEDKLHLKGILFSLIMKIDNIDDLIKELVSIQEQSEKKSGTKVNEYER